MAGMEPDMPKPLTCPPDVLSRKLTGQRVIVTGANSGIGRVTARQLAKQGASVTLACRRIDEGEALAAEIRTQISGADVQARALDLGDLASVRAFANGFRADHDALHLLINNAGVMNTPHGKTADGFETQIGVNHLGHFLLTELLLDLLKRSAPSRVVVLSSCFHDKAMGREGDIDLDDLHFERRRYDGWEAYAQSKLANLLHARELARRLEGTGVTAVSAHPGWVRTNLMLHSMPVWVQDFILRPILGQMGMIEPWEGAQTSLYAALGDDVVQHAGAYFSQTGTYRDKALNRGGWPLTSPNPHAHDDDLAAALYDKSLELVGLKANPSTQAAA
jgi:NAD(P)-dependent dehydrogenase (short-subunit alcohol dehydrogenase family)